MATVEENHGRPIAQFHPSHWGNLFLNYVPHDVGSEEKEIDELKKNVSKQLLEFAETEGDERLELIDAIQRLGIAYHFEEELEQMSQRIFDAICDPDIDSNANKDLYFTSLCFRVLRQRGFFISLDVFNNFKDETGKFSECLNDDIEGMLSLYEASNVRIPGEDFLDDAFVFTKMHLSSMVDNLTGPIKEKVVHALKQSCHRGMTRLESRNYISMYKSDPSHDETLLKLAKLDFNFLLSLHTTELRDIARWWDDILSSYKFARDRLAEAYFWTLGVFYEPQYSLARKIFCKTLLIMSIIDDIYDAYGLYEELQILTEAIHRWDKSCSNELPDYIKFVYESLLSIYEEFEQDLAEQGRSYLVHYVKEQLKILCDTYMQEAKWRHDKEIPTYDEYVNNSGVSFGYEAAIAVCFLGMGKLATAEAFEWAKLRPKALIASGVMGRLKNDMGGNKFQQGRDHVASAIECYMEQYDVEEDEARAVLNKHVENTWKDVNEGLLLPHAIAWPLQSRILQLARAVDVIYKNEDSYTNVCQTMKDNIKLVLIKQVDL